MMRCYVIWSSAMNPLIIQCSDYLKKYLDLEVQRVPEQNFQFPVYITANYQLDMIHLQNKEYVVMIPDLKKGLTPSQIQKHIQKVMDITKLGNLYCMLNCKPCDECV